MIARWLSVALIAGMACAADVEQVDSSLAVRDIHGILQHPFQAAAKSAAVVFFITNDCPISNGYAREMRRICETYSGRASCALDYIDPTLSIAEAAKHYSDYGHGGYPAIVDTKHLLVKAAGATVTPEALVVAPDGKIAYRGRIDDKNVALGVARPQATRNDLRLAIDSVLAGRPVELPRTKAIGCYITPIEFFKK